LSIEFELYPLSSIASSVEPELTVKQVSENEKMCVAGYPRRSEDAIQDIFHKAAKLKKKRMNR
jgi:DNA polymerase/3'-5' exonuclease PolX